MLSAGHEVCILSLGKLGRPFFKINEVVTVKFANQDPIPLKFVHKIRWFLNTHTHLNLFIKEHSIQAVIGEGHNISSLLSFIGTRNLLRIASEHIDYTSIPAVSRFFMKLAYPRLSAVVVLSEIAHRKARHLNRIIAVIPNALPFTTSETSALQEKKIIMVGRLSKEKGYERVVGIARRLMLEYPDWTISIYGKGPEETALKMLFKKEGLSNVVFHPPVEDIQNKYLMSSIFLITSYREAQPMVILEAQNCGLPVVGFRCEGTESLIKDGDNGFIVDTERQCYEKLQYLILNKSKRAEMAAKGREAVSVYNQDSIKDMWERVLQTQAGEIQ